tara:strand:+ start:1322 stop:1543 length:222 start_codon:yes stop_codon:yes gene_type:complete
MKKTFLFFLLYFLVFTSEAFAYFDPGTGAFIIQAILGFLAAVVASLTMTWSRVKMFFIKIFKKKSKSEKKENK